MMGEIESWWADFGGKWENFEGKWEKFQTKWRKFSRKRTLKQSKEECPLSSPCPLCIPNILLLPVFLISIPSAYQYATISLKTSIFFGSFLIGGSVSISAGTLLWIYRRLIDRSYIALARQDQYIGSTRKTQILIILVFVAVLHLHL